MSLINGHVWIPIAPNWKFPPAMSREYDTKIQTSADRSEKRSSMRKRSLVTLEFTITTAQFSETPELEQDIRDALEAAKVAVPYHGRGIHINSDASGTSVTVKDNLWNWKVGDYFAIYDGDLVEFNKITAISGNTWTTSSTLDKTYDADQAIVWPILFGEPSIPNGYLSHTSKAGDIKLKIKQMVPYPSDYLLRPDSSGNAVDEPVDLSVIPVGHNSDEALTGLDSQLTEYSGTPVQICSTLWYGHAYYSNNDPNTISGERKQFLYDVLLWEFENHKLDSDEIIGERSGITWQSDDFGTFLSAESARNDQSTLVEPGFPGGISQFVTSGNQAYTLCFYYDQIADTGGTSESKVDFDPDDQPTDPGELFTKFENFHVLDDRCESSESKDYFMDSRKQKIGFNSPSVSPQQSHTIHALKAKRYLKGERELVLDDKFWDEVRGQGLPFWFPAPFEEFVITEAISTTQFKIRDRDFNTEYNDHPSRYILIRREDGTTHISKISGASDNGDGTETVTLETAASPAITTDDAAFKLHLVRLKSPVKTEYLEKEQLAFSNLDMIELPYEYGQTVSVPIKAYLYRITCNGKVWNFTSFEDPISSTLNGAYPSENYSVKQLTHGAIKKTTKSEREELQIEAELGTIEPFDLWHPLALSQPMWVEVCETTQDAANTTTCLFFGKIQSVQPQARKLIIKATGILDALADRVPRMLISPRCNHHVYDSGCGLSKATYEESVTITAINGIDINISGATLTENGDYSFGWVEVLANEKKEIRSIVKSVALGSGAHTLYLNKPFDRATTSDALTLYRGCDGLYNTCNTKFANTDNFGGHPFVPNNNLSLKAMNIPTTGGKK